MHSLKLTLENDPKPEELELISNKLNQFNEERAGRDNFAPLTIFLRDKQDSVVGGCMGETYWEWGTAQNFV